MDWEREEEATLMQRAMDCANSDSCSLSEAENYLESVLHLQSECASGSLVGSEVCSNINDAAEAVASLKEKITMESRKMV